MEPVPKKFQVPGPAMPRTEPLAPRRGRYGRMNLVVTAAQVAGWAALLTVADAASLHWALRAGAIVLFCFLVQGVFSMMHEYFHYNAHRDRRLNYLIGFVGSTLFGTSATLHRVNHWGHHVRNRSEAERGDYIHEDETPVKKVLLYYFATWGGLWIGGIVFPLLALLIPYRAAAWLARTKRFNTYAAAFEQFQPADWAAMRLEALWLAGFWTLVVLFGPWSWQTLAIAYGAFAFSWSIQQWMYHLRTPIHVIEGAYNARLVAPLRWLILNFNYNLTHHRHPGLPWQELPSHTDVKETQPFWYRVVQMFLPPRRYPPPPHHLEKRYF